MKSALDETLINEAFAIPLVLRDGPDGARHYGIVRMPQKFPNEGFGSCVCPDCTDSESLQREPPDLDPAVVADGRLPVRS